MPSVKSCLPGPVASDDTSSRQLHNIVTGTRRMFARLVCFGPLFLKFQTIAKDRLQRFLGRGKRSCLLCLPWSCACRIYRLQQCVAHDLPPRSDDEANTHPQLVPFNQPLVNHALAADGSKRLRQ